MTPSSRSLQALKTACADYRHHDRTCLSKALLTRIFKRSRFDKAPNGQHSLSTPQLFARPFFSSQTVEPLSSPFISTPYISDEAIDPQRLGQRETRRQNVLPFLVDSLGMSPQRPFPGTRSNSTTTKLTLKSTTTNDAHPSKLGFVLDCTYRITALLVEKGEGTAWVQDTSIYLLPDTEISLRAIVAATIPNIPFAGYGLQLHPSNCFRRDDPKSIVADQSLQLYASHSSPPKLKLGFAKTSLLHSIATLRHSEGRLFSSTPPNSLVEPPQLARSRGLTFNIRQGINYPPFALPPRFSSELMAAESTGTIEGLWFLEGPKQCLSAS
ncbi:hypothetical protein CPB83DRAFT_900314 [Crepidotus variabilis]|uniref:Uncharacterized protein n=1 Tax=Crepidotus variabilis TaxID=179855 RepID=A0A9P6E3D4_9AGAR|nr:hypothetical protein CPB83DRAFT_900314 [Crepidotus variabilis]